MASATYTVEGMTCQHCVRSVEEEVGEIDAVTGVTVDLATGRLVVDSSTELSPDLVRAAVAEAGYTLAN
ncbi:heavy-metal-associated domain-containing protein [Actinoalloteichus spitiensis]|uniref:heavy-metal-associated domain-containing protein n=1 Tax=Actinoalloteichus spitiensis TaxID=252394 RepID=UPI0004747144|nr:heavy metal-associated domain-containing protein [Actinoalloteichus spitiensis]